MDDRAAPYVLAAGESRRDDAILPFKALAADTGGRLSACEFTLGGWEPGPVLHKHDQVDEAFYVIRGKLEAQLGDRRSRRRPVGSCGFRAERLTPSRTPGRSRSRSWPWPWPSPAAWRSCSPSRRRT